MTLARDPDEWRGVQGGPSGRRSVRVCLAHGLALAEDIVAHGVDVLRCASGCELAVNNNSMDSVGVDLDEGLQWEVRSE